MDTGRTRRGGMGIRCVCGGYWLSIISKNHVVVVCYCDIALEGGAAG
jgi:hypothetical protein